MAHHLQDKKRILLTLRNLANLNRGGEHEIKKNVCKSCDNTLGSVDELHHHIGCEHEDMKVPCNSCDKTLRSENEFCHHRGVEHEKRSSSHEVFLSHHAETINVDEIEVDPIVWAALFSDDEKDLTEAEEKEILKLHRYFAHRSGSKLWENLFQPAGKFKGKKKYVLNFLDQCEICKKHKRSPPKPKVGLPKAKDVNEVVGQH